MKKVLSVILLVVIFAVSYVGCSSKAPQNQPQSQPGASVSHGGVNSGGQTTTSGSADTASFIGEDKAKEIALDKAGISADGVIFDRVELDRDDGIWQYEVEFRQGKAEYDADIKADDGTVLSWETDYDD